MSDIEGVKRSEGTNLQRWNAVNAVVHGTRRTGEVEDEVDLAHVEGFADIFLDELESRFVPQVFKIGAPTGKQVVDDNHTPALGEQGIAQVGSQKTGATRDYSALSAH